jgi:hypothetical protein
MIVRDRHPWTSVESQFGSGLAAERQSDYPGLNALRAACSCGDRHEYGGSSLTWIALVRVANRVATARRSLMRPGGVPALSSRFVAHLRIRHVAHETTNSVCMPE